MVRHCSPVLGSGRHTLLRTADYVDPWSLNSDLHACTASYLHMYHLGEGEPARLHPQKLTIFCFVINKRLPVRKGQGEEEEPEESLQRDSQNQKRKTRRKSWSRERFCGMQGVVSCVGQCCQEAKSEDAACRSVGI